MKTLPLIGLLAACCAMSTVWAAEAAPAKPAAPPAATPAATPEKPAATPEKPAAAESATPKSDEDPKVKEDAGAADKAAAAGKSKPSPADKAGDKSSPQRFVPSEQVRADFDVSFPIDI
jgi:hypothetical protein